MSELEPQLSSDLIARSLNYHGQMLQKTWESEKSDNLQKMGINNLEFTVYQQRQKYLSFQDRGKRLKLQQFIVKKSNELFDPNVMQIEETRSRPVDSGHFALMPPFGYFLSLDKTSRLQHLFQILKIGDAIISNVTTKNNAGLILKVVCVGLENVYSVDDLNVKAFCPTSKLISAVDKKNQSRSFMVNDLVCCEVLEVIPECEKIICGMSGTYSSIHRARLGLFHPEDFPEPYK
uniref:S1 motif domain-containing protein n=2 Tax=Clastoptera arizonana TaxID=38151 RepID=A0A1B6DD97_9HEMI